MRKPRRILVGLKTPESAIELTDVACRLSGPRTALLLAHVIELPDVTPLDAEVPELDRAAARILHAAERVARRAGLAHRTLELRAHDAGAALLDEMKQRKIDLALLGYHHRRTLGEILLGTTARKIARKAPCHLIFVVPPRG